MNRRGRSWDFPNHGNDEQISKLYRVRIQFLETENANLRDRIEQLEQALADAGTPLPEEILDAHIVEDLDP